MSNYRIERLIGIGGEAVVYEARSLLPGGEAPLVACKLMRQERRAAPQARALVQQEAALGLRITPGHPNLVRVLDFFVDAGEGPCIVMERVDGGSLKALLEPDRRLPFPVTRRILIEVLQALAHLHGQDVLHRDLSPCNILISTGGSVKIADLGIAKVMERGHAYTANYRGKLAYDSPEGIQTLTLDARSDLYTLGAVLYELLAGTPPCGEDEAFADVVTRTLRGDFAPLPPDTPQDLADLALGLLRIQPDARKPQSATEALALLRRHGQPIASTAELAALVIARKTQRDAEPEGADRAPDLVPGELLAPGDELVAYKALAPGEPAPDAVRAQPPAPLPTLVFPLPAEPPLPPLPQPRQHHRAVARPRPGAGRSRVHGAMVMRAARAAVLVFCVLVSGFLLQDRLRGERRAGDTAKPPELPVLVAPAPPVTPERFEATQKDEIPRPRHAHEKHHADGSHPARTRTQAHPRRARPDELRWDLMPRRSEPSAWAIR